MRRSAFSFPMLLAAISADEVDDVTDVCVLGAGAGGTYASLLLKEAGLSVRLLERSGELGGNCDTYSVKDGAFNMTLGLVVHPNTRFVHDVYAKVNMALKPLPLDNSLRSIDFSTGKAVRDPYSEVLTSSSPQRRRVRNLLFGSSPSFNLQDVLDAIERVQQLMQQYSFYQDFARFPDTIPPELLVPYSELQADLELEPIWYMVKILNGGRPDILGLPAYMALMVLRPEVIGVLFGFGLRAQCKEWYRRVGQLLQADVILGASITHVERPKAGVTSITYHTGSAADQQTVMCAAIFVAYDQSVESLAPFDLDEEETAIFGQIVPLGYPSLALRFKASDAFVSTAESWQGVDPKEPFLQPQAPYVFAVQEMFREGEYVYANAQVVLEHGLSRPTAEEVTDFVAQAIERTEFVVPGSVELLRYNVHAFAYEPPAQAVAAGFYGSLHGLQGRRSTYHIGSAMSYEAHDDCWRQAQHVVNLFLLQRE